MANWCFNRVEFHADEAQLAQLKQFFSALAEKEFETKQAQLPDFLNEQNGYLFDIEFEQGMLFYQTKWVPNTDVIVEIGKHFNVNFKYNYEEYGNQLFGEAIYENGELSLIELDSLDLDSLEFDQATETYLFELSHFEMIDHIVEMLIDRKRLSQNPPN
jgi:hypothetical protein